MHRILRCGESTNNQTKRGQEHYQNKDKQEQKQGDKGGRSQEGAGTGGARQDPGRSHDDGPRSSRWREEPWRRNGHQRQRSRWRRAWSWGVDQEGQSRADDAGGGGGDPEGHSGAGATEDWGGAEVMVGAWRSRKGEAQPEEWSPEAQEGRCQTKAEPVGRGSQV